MKKLIAGLGIAYLVRKNFGRRRRLALWRQRRGVTLLGFGAVTAGIWLAMKAVHQVEELPPRIGDEPWTSRKKQRREARVAEARARAQTTVRSPDVHVEANADPSLKVRLGDI